MPVSVYNSLTKKKEKLVSQDGKTVRMYSCGVTVYDRSHIGHARSLYLFEVIRRYLKFRGFQVRFIRNITDIDDKIINKARETGKDWKEVVAENIEAYANDLNRLGVPPADVEPRATDNIPEMIAHIRGLIDRGFAYHADGDVYFRVRQFKEYGKLSGQSVDQMQEAVRIEKDEKKDDPLDFALWKKSKEGEPSWDSPWGAGRPGWHIECSVMSLKYCGCETLDIHAGGRDLIFPHHENEIAQAEAFTGKPFARAWIHHGLLTINGQKMAKSLGNFVTIEDAVRKYGADILKLFFLSSHYGSNIDFSDDKMQETKKAYARIDILMKKFERKYGTRDVEKARGGGAGDMGRFREEFISAMDNDFNTPQALSVLFEMVSQCNKLMDSDDESKDFMLAYAMNIMKEMIEIFDLKFIEQNPTEISDSQIESQISARKAFKKAKKYKAADQIRSELEQKGIILEDSKEGGVETTTWRRKI